MFWVSGVPLPKGNMAPIRRGSSILMDQNNMATKRRKSGGLDRWADAVAQAARAHGARVIEGPVELDLVFSMPRLKSRKAAARPLPTVRPDTSKLIRAVEDALIGIAYADDCQVTTLRARKQYEGAMGPGVMVTVKEAA